MGFALDLAVWTLYWLESGVFGQLSVGNILLGMANMAVNEKDVGFVQFGSLVVGWVSGDGNTLSCSFVKWTFFRCSKEILPGDIPSVTNMLRFDTKFTLV